MKLVVRGASERLRPILMTTGAAGLAILPLIIFGNLPGTRSNIDGVVILGPRDIDTAEPVILPAFYLRSVAYWRANGQFDRSRIGTSLWSV